MSSSQDNDDASDYSSEASLESSQASSYSSSSSQDEKVSRKPTNKKTQKLDFKHLDPELYGLRRSGRVHVLFILYKIYRMMKVMTMKKLLPLSNENLPKRKVYLPSLSHLYRNLIMV